MPKKDIYHNTVKRALEKDGWTITHDPFTLSIGDKDLFADLGAERIISAQKGVRKIIVEVKSFVSQSEVYDLEQATGQYTIYLRILKKAQSEWLLYLAVPKRTFKSIFQHELGELLLEDGFLNLIVFDEEQEEIVRWIPD